ncbi:MAG: serine/threonine protein kinase, partial [Acidobacteria bacterium]|nr:serine/threonine protein kinase [Acidobacteriota bacterium]
MKTTSQRTEWPQVNEMFERLLDLPLQEQEEELRRFKEERPELARRVRDLLEADRRAEDFLQPPWPSASRSSPDGVVEGEEWVLGPSAIRGTDDPLPLEGQVGPYRLTRCLGRGGMGVVYRGERADGRYDGQVAVKFLHSPRASPEVLRRFQQETSILARLEHPNIARLIDSGETPSGRPYLILEYVEGSPIDVFCRRRDLSLQERIRLFLKVCQAADFAHQHLVVHRDIKPENLLVTDGGEPKLLDFGIAKLLEMEGAEALTQGSLRPMTPRYASPEQRAAGTITVATDVYSLGLVLHHLLRGCLPGAEPPPEAAMSESLPQDLQGILEKALEEDPGCRYRSAGAFASDLENFLEGRPVEARPATAFYRFRKLVARNRLLSTLSGVLLLSLLGFSVAMSHQVSSLRKKQSLLEREQARKDRLLETVIDLFQLADPWQGSTEDLTVRSALKANAGTLRERFHGDPDLQVEIAMAVGTIYHRLNLHEEALEQFEAA